MSHNYQNHDNYVRRLTGFTDFKSKNIETERNKDSGVKSPICEKERPE